MYAHFSRMEDWNSYGHNRILWSEGEHSKVLIIHVCVCACVCVCVCVVFIPFEEGPEL